MTSLSKKKLALILISFFLPVVGFILFLINRVKNPYSSQYYLASSIIGFIVFAGIGYYKSIQ